MNNIRLLLNHVAEILKVFSFCEHKLIIANSTGQKFAKNRKNLHIGYHKMKTARKASIKMIKIIQYMTAKILH